VIVSVTLEQFGLSNFSSADRMELVGLLWDSLEETERRTPEWHLQVIAQRVAEANANPTAGILWSEFKEKWLEPA
jgi:putative addiction module component (TIGR02574 family)